MGTSSQASMAQQQDEQRQQQQTTGRGQPHQSIPPRFTRSGQQQQQTSLADRSTNFSNNLSQQMEVPLMSPAYAYQQQQVYQHQQLILHQQQQQYLMLLAQQQHQHHVGGRGVNGGGPAARHSQPGTYPNEHVSHFQPPNQGQNRSSLGMMGPGQLPHSLAVREKPQQSSPAELSQRGIQQAEHTLKTKPSDADSVGVRCEDLASRVGGAYSPEQHGGRGSRNAAGLGSLPPRPDGFSTQQGANLAPSSAPPTRRAQQAMAGVAAPSAPTVPLIDRLPPFPPAPAFDEGSLTATEVRDAYVAREEALLLRIEALGFEPEGAFSVYEQVQSNRKADESDALQLGESGEASTKATPVPVLGVRLLQRIDMLEAQNQELEANHREQERRGRQELDEFFSDLKDAHALIDGLDRALQGREEQLHKAEARCQTLEQALAVACATRSSGFSSKPTTPRPTPEAKPSPSSMSSSAVAAAQQPPQPRWQPSLAPAAVASADLPSPRRSPPSGRGGKSRKGKARGDVQVADGSSLRPTSKAN